MSIASKIKSQNDDAVFAEIKKRKRVTTAELAKATGARADIIEGCIDRLQERGVLVHKRGSAWVLDKEPPVGSAKDFVFTSDASGKYRFGFSSDQHICSKYSRLDVLDDLYQKFADRGIRTVFNGGNWIDGEARFNKHDLLVHGCDAQCRELAKVFPRHKGITTYAVAGDDHEGWYNQQLGIDIGAYAAEKMRDAGRNDWVNLGYMEAFVTLRHRKTAKECKGMIMHPGGGSAYAISYKPQKIAESFSGGDKPAFMVIAHYHKMSYQLTRNIHTVQSGTTEDQTPFMRKKGLDAHVGGGIMELEQDPRTGALTACKVEFFNYFVKGYYNGRWSHSGDVVHAKRLG